MGTKTYEVDIDLRYIFEEIDDEELIKEVNRRGILEDLLPDEDEELEAKNPLDMPSYEFRRYICDILNLGHHVSDDTIVNEIKSRI